MSLLTTLSRLPAMVPKICNIANLKTLVHQLQMNVNLSHYTGVGLIAACVGVDLD